MRSILAIASVYNIRVYLFFLAEFKPPIIFTMKIMPGLNFLHSIYYGIIGRASKEYYYSPNEKQRDIQYPTAIILIGFHSGFILTLKNIFQVEYCLPKTSSEICL